MLKNFVKGFILTILFSFFLFSVASAKTLKFSFKLEDADPYFASHSKAYLHNIENIVRSEYETYLNSLNDHKEDQGQIEETLSLKSRDCHFLETSKSSMLQLKNLKQNEKIESQDLRALSFVTLDNEFTISRDQAIFIKKEEKNSQIFYTFYYALADVTSYFSLNSPLDQEAYLRQFTSYPYGMHSFRMINQKFSTKISSLEEDSEHRSLVAEIKLKKEKNSPLVVLSSKFYRALIQVKLNTDFKTVQGAWEHRERIESLPKEIQEQIFLMKELGTSLVEMYKIKNQRIPSYDQINIRERKDDSHMVDIEVEENNAMSYVEIINQAFSKISNDEASTQDIFLSTPFKNIRITAPIRRYQDEIIHRIILGENIPLSYQEKVAKASELAEKRDALISRKTRDYMMTLGIAAFLNKNDLNYKFEAKISDLDKEITTLRFKDFPFIISYPKKDIPLNKIINGETVIFKVKLPSNLRSGLKLTF